jgi:hypothetical protein
VNYEAAYKKLVDDLQDLCHTNAPEGVCLYYVGEDDPQDCMSHCDCSWGSIYYKSILDLIKPTNEGE